MTDTRFNLEDQLYRRVGELTAGLGRYDMYALALETLLRAAAPKLPKVKTTIATRGAVIDRLLEATGTSITLRRRFRGIDLGLQRVLARQAISAKHPAVIAARDSTSDSALGAQPRDWFDHAAATDAQLSVFVGDIEKEIVLVASLYVSLAGFAGHLANAMADRHQ